MVHAPDCTFSLCSASTGRLAAGDPPHQGECYKAAVLPPPGLLLRLSAGPMPRLALCPLLPPCRRSLRTEKTPGIATGGRAVQPHFGFRQRGDTRRKCWLPSLDGLGPLFRSFSNIISCESRLVTLCRTLFGYSYSTIGRSLAAKIRENGRSIHWLDGCGVGVGRAAHSVGHLLRHDGRLDIPYLCAVADIGDGAGVTSEAR